MSFQEIHTCIEMMGFIRDVGFLPLLDSGIEGFSAEDIVDEDLYGKEACMYDRTPEESFKRIYDHLKVILPDASDKQILKLIG